MGISNISTCGVKFRSSTASPISSNIHAEYKLPVNDRMDPFVRGLLTLSSTSQNDPAHVYDDYDQYGRINLYAGVRDPDGAWGGGGVRQEHHRALRLRLALGGSA